MEFLHALLSSDYFALFFIIAIGILLGKIDIKGVSFGASAVIFIAMFYGYMANELNLSLKIPGIIQNIGLVLFIFTIGMQAGPSFFEAFKSQGAKLIVLAVLAVVVGGLTTAICSYFFGVDLKIAVGLMTGALTSTPGLAAAIEASQSPLASIGYGIAYPFGVIGVILFVKISPKLFRANIATEEAEYEASNAESTPEIHTRVLEVSNQNVDGKTIAELGIRFMTKATVSRVLKPGKESTPPSANTALSLGDLVRVVGTQEALDKAEVLLGHKSDKDIPLSGLYDVRWYIVSKRIVVNKSLNELGLIQRYNGTVTRIRRAGVDLVPRPSSKLRFGDKLLISVPVSNIESLSQELGDNLKEVETASFLPVCLGIVAGVLLGKVQIPMPGGAEFSLGLTGGVLIAALLLSRWGKVGGIIFNVPSQANQLLRQFGLLLFLTPVGIDAGTKVVGAITEYGAGLFAIGAIITIVPMIVVLLIGRLVFNVNFLSLLGALTGGMTSTPGLSAMDSMTESDAPQIAYATVYPFALVTMIIVAQILGAMGAMGFGM